MFGHFALQVGLVSLLAAFGMVAASDPKRPVGLATPWPFDVVSLKNGATFRGLILQESENRLDFQVVRRLPGRPTVTLTTSFLKREIALVKRLSPADRQLLQDRLDELDPDREEERARMELLEWQPAEWLGKPNRARQYESDQFVLISGGPEEVSRRAAVRLEQIYAAFARILPPRHQADRPTRIYLAGTMNDYRQLLGPVTQPILNPAVYDPVHNRVFCGSDLTKLGQELADKRETQRQQYEALKQYELQIRRLYKNSKQDLDRFLERVSLERKKLRDAARANEAVFDAATQRLFALLYHESFHSYTNTYVYPLTGRSQLPRWLNEGLAQIFETAVLEAGELRIDHADRERLERVKQLLKPGGAGLIPCGELLVAGKEQFLAAHVDQQATADRVYLTSWALTLYLTFERRAVGTPEFEKFLLSGGSPAEKKQALLSWTGLEPDKLDQEVRGYFQKLPPDGSLPVRR